jgi:hypothetical protein
MKAAGYFPIIGILVLVTLAATAVAVATTPWGPGSGAPTPVPPPTPGPEPTLVPDLVSRGAPVTTRDEAIRRALYIDPLGTVREQPLTEEAIAANPDMVVVEFYATRQEASDVYWGDRFADPKAASEPMWVVIIKGKVLVRVVGGLGTMPEFVEADGVTYGISALDGKVLRVVAGIAKKRP